MSYIFVFDVFRKANILYHNQSLKILLYFQFILKCLPCLSIRCRNIFPKCIPKKEGQVEIILLESNSMVVVNPVVQQEEEISHA